MIETDGLDLLLGWGIFLGLLAVLAWLLLRSGQNDALSSIGKPPAEQPHHSAGDPPDPDDD
ncbi:MAG TPA: hypothetical protein VFP72_03545 [Kineosporiaceae bacterium]|nr:hypothetical protein [Kineosporiaceae bacterium]